MRDPALGGRLWPWLVASVALHLALVHGTRDLSALPASTPPPRHTTAIRVRVVTPKPPSPTTAAPPVEKPPPPSPRPEPRKARPPEPKPAPKPTPEKVAVPLPPVAAAHAAPAPTEVDAPADSAEPATAAPAQHAEAAAAERVSSYIAEVRARVAAQKRYPSMARRRGLEGRVEVRVEIAADGQLVEMRIAEGAPSVLARATRQAVERAAPFPVPPGGAVWVELPIRYDLAD